MTLAAIRRLPRAERLALYRSLRDDPAALARLVAPNEVELVTLALELGGSREAAQVLLASAAELLRAPAAP